MGSRRNFIKGLLAGTAIAGLPAASEVKRLTVTESDSVIITFPGTLTDQARREIASGWSSKFPNVPVSILEDGMDILVLKNVKAKSIPRDKRLPWENKS